MISIIIPANNEEACISRCLSSVLNQTQVAEAEVIVVANACTDRTVEIAQDKVEPFAAKGAHLKVIETEVPGKLNALNLGDSVAGQDNRLYLDADIELETTLLARLLEVLTEREGPVYATGRLQLMQCKSWFSRAYGRFWMTTPFIRSEAVGAGVFAVNAAGRARWQAFPDIISDDTFVRLNFAPSERVQVDAAYRWPLVEGFWNLTKVRRRQDQGVRQIHEDYPALAANEGKAVYRLGDIAKAGLADPPAFVAYFAVYVSSRLFRTSNTWSRGR